MSRFFSERAIQIVAEDKIQAAIREGEFDHLPGFGKPCALIDEPYDEYWWVRRKIIAEELRQLVANAGGDTPQDAMTSSR